MSDLIEDLRRGAETARQAFGRIGYYLDFSFESLGEVDRFFDEQAPGGQPTPRGELAERLPGKLFSLGAYVGETLVRSCDGRWLAASARPAAELEVRVALPGGATLAPIRLVMRRFRQGPGAGVLGGIVALVGPRARRPRKQRWWSLG